MTNEQQSASAFIDHVLPEAGPYAALILSDKMRQLVRNTKSDLLDTLYAASADGLNTFFGLASYGSVRGKGFREKNNVRALRAVWHDVDINKKGAHATQNEAVAAVYALVANDKLLAPTYMVSSGFGLHLYWCIDRDITVDEWNRAANQTKGALLNDPKLCVDTTRVLDAASILRMPGTINYKGSSAPVELLQAGSLYTLGHLDDAYGDPVPSQARKAAPTGALLGPPIAYSKPPLGTLKRIEVPGSKPTAAQLIGACNQFKYYATHQNEQSEPLWRALLGLCRYTQEGETLAHAISKNYDGYTAAATTSKYSGWNGNWPSCEGVEGASGRANLCDGCPLKGKGKSPLHGALSAAKAIEHSEPGAPPPEKRAVTTAPVTTDGHVLPPEPYKLKDTQTWTRVPVESEDEAGNEIVKWIDKQLFSFRVVITKLGIDEDNLMYVHMKISHVCKAKVTTQDLVAPAASLLETRTCTSVFAGIGLSPGSHQTAALALRTFLGRYIDHVRIHAGTEREYARFGWSEDRKRFIVGQTTYAKGEAPTEALLSRQLVSFTRDNRLAPHGTLKGWQECVQPLMNNQQCPHFTLAVLSGFAATLMYMTPEKNGIMFLHSEATGTGKTLAVSMANSVFSTFGTGEKTAGSTDKSLSLICEKYHSLVSIYDECTNMYSDQASKMIYTMTSQQGGSALTKDREVRQAGSWSTIHLLTANISMEGLITRDARKTGRLSQGAEILRGWDVKVPRSEEFYSILDTIDDHSFEENHGVAGPLFIQYVLDNVDAIKAMMKEARKEVAKFNTKDTRYTNNLAACLHVAGDIVNRLGILEIDMSWLTRNTGKLQKQAKDKHQEHNPVEAATTLLSRIMRDRFVGDGTNMVYVNHRSRKLTRLGKGNDGYDEQSSCDVRVSLGPDVDQVTVHIRTMALKEACERIGIAESSALAELWPAGLQGDNGKPLRVVASLNAGSNDTASLTRARCFVFALDKLAGGIYNDVIAVMKDREERGDGKVVPLHPNAPS